MPKPKQLARSFSESSLFLEEFHCLEKASWRESLFSFRCQSGRRRKSKVKRLGLLRITLGPQYNYKHPVYNEYLFRGFTMFCQTEKVRKEPPSLTILYSKKFLWRNTPSVPQECPAFHQLNLGEVTNLQSH